MDKKNIDFVRLDILENWRFWNKYAKTKDFEGAGKEVIQQANALLAQDLESNPRAAKLLYESIEFQAKKKEAGRKGGLAKARNAKSATVQPAKNKPLTKDNVYNFAADHNLDTDDARTWFEQNFVERPGCDKNGEVIKNWQGALINYCKAEKAKREN